MEISWFEKYLQKIITSIIVISPLLSMYGIGFSIVTLLDFLIIILGILVRFVYIKKPNILKEILNNKSSKVLLFIIFVYC